MNEVRRYTWDEDEGGWSDNEGDTFCIHEVLVKFRDYEKLKVENERLRRALEAISNPINSEAGNFHGSVLQSMAREALKSTI